MMNKKFGLKLVLLVVLMVVGVIASPKREAFAAADPVQVCAVSYADESILVIANGNTKILYATEMEAARGNWDSVEVISGNKLAVIDISWLSPSTENIIKIKGDDNETMSRVILLQKPTKLDVSINYSLLDNLASGATIGELLNIMTTEGSAATPITFLDLEWKKGEAGQWMSTGLLKKNLLESFLMKGTNLYFRIAPKDDVVSANSGAFDLGRYARTYAYHQPSFGDAGLTSANTLTFGTDYPDGTKGRRASGEVKLKIARKAVLPVTGIDGEEFMINIKYGQEYRVTATNGATTVKFVDWTKITDRYIKKMSFATMLGGTYNGITTAFPEMRIEVRNYSTSKASSSKITETQLEAQRTMPGTILPGPAPNNVDATNKNVYISYNGSKNIILQIPSASEENPYEYCVVKDGYTFDLSRASWTAITKGTIVKILSSKALDYSTLHIRQKEIKYRAAKDTSSAVAYKLASTIQTFKVNYPTIPFGPKNTIYTFTKGYTKELTIEVTLNVLGKLPFETQLKYIKLGTKDVPISGTPLIDPVIPDTGDISTQVYKMKIKLDVTALETMTNCTARALSIYYMNGTVDKTSSKLTIKNPTEALKLTTTTSPGTVDGTTSVAIASATGADNHLVFEITPKEVTGVKMEDKFAGTNVFSSGMNVTITAGQYLTIYELDINNYVMKYKSVLISASDIKQPGTTP